ncbi:hypothetical protein ZWY2020_057535 [Hordeum vulgare]|nr:hypothetical protein ZWY2020_057535 [Hordeum vulgare]
MADRISSVLTRGRVPPTQTTAVRVAKLAACTSMSWVAVTTACLSADRRDGSPVCTMAAALGLGGGGGRADIRIPEDGRREGGELEEELEGLEQLRARWPHRLQRTHLRGFQQVALQWHVSKQRWQMRFCSLINGAEAGRE